ncbi:MAG: casein kinase 1 family protein [archaeon]|nr:casein kinase 1 family protein [archaeon]
MINSPRSKIFFSKYKPDKKIGEGSFGKIYLSHNIQTGQKFAIKLENKNVSQSLLEQEAFLLCYLKGEGIPLIKSFGYNNDYNVLVMELLGKSLEDLFLENHSKFSLKTVCMLGIQMISRIEYIHNKHILHRDIKPDNFTIGYGENSYKVYIIDFGLSKKYRSSKTLQHIKYHEGKKLTGTARYASIRALKGCEQGRRDDVEAIGYVLMYFLRGSLPWQGLKINKKEDRYQKIYEKKKSTTAEELCQGFPKEFCDYVNYTRNMEFEQEPDYNYLRGLFQKVMKDNGYAFDYQYDWVENTKNQNKSLINLGSTRDRDVGIETQNLINKHKEHNNLNETGNLEGNNTKTKENPNDVSKRNEFLNIPLSKNYSQQLNSFTSTGLLGKEDKKQTDSNKCVGEGEENKIEGEENKNLNEIKKDDINNSIKKENKRNQNIIAEEKKKEMKPKEEERKSKNSSKKGISKTKGNKPLNILNEENLLDSQIKAKKEKAMKLRAAKPVQKNPIKKEELIESKKNPKPEINELKEEDTKIKTKEKESNTNNYNEDLQWQVDSNEEQENIGCTSPNHPPVIKRKRLIYNSQYKFMSDVVDKNDKNYLRTSPPTSREIFHTAKKERKEDEEEIIENDSNEYPDNSDNKNRNINQIHSNIKEKKFQSAFDKKYSYTARGGETSSSIRAHTNSMANQNNNDNCIII